MAATPAHITSNSSSELNTVTTANINLAANALQIVTVIAAGGTTLSDNITLSGGGRVWASLFPGVAYGTRRKMFAFRSLGAAVANTTITATYGGSDQTAQEISIVVTEWSGVITGGTNGELAHGTIATPITAGGNSVSPTVTGIPGVEDAIFTAMGCEVNGTVTPEASFIQGVQLVTTNVRRHVTAWDATGTLDTTPLFSWSGANGYAAWAVIIRGVSGGTIFTKDVLGSITSGASINNRSLKGLIANLVTSSLLLRRESKSLIASIIGSSILPKQTLKKYLANLSLQGTLNNSSPSSSKPIFDAVATNTADSKTWNHTVGDNNNRIVIVSTGGSTTAPTAVTFGGQAMTKIGGNLQIVGNGAIETSWYLFNPPTGVQAVVCTTTATSFIGGSLTFYNISQLVAPITTTITGAPGPLTLSLTMSSATDEMVIGNLILNNTVTAFSQGDQTQRYYLNPTFVGTLTAVTEPGAVSNTVSWTINTSYEYAIRGIRLKVANTNFLKSLGSLIGLSGIASNRGNKISVGSSVLVGITNKVTLVRYLGSSLIFGQPSKQSKKGFVSSTTTIGSKVNRLSIIKTAIITGSSIARLVATKKGVGSSVLTGTKQINLAKQQVGSSTASSNSAKASSAIKTGSTTITSNNTKGIRVTDTGTTIPVGAKANRTSKFPVGNITGAAQIVRSALLFKTSSVTTSSENTKFLTKQIASLVGSLSTIGTTTKVFLITSIGSIVPIGFISHLTDKPIIRSVTALSSIARDSFKSLAHSITASSSLDLISGKLKAFFGEISPIGTIQNKAQKISLADIALVSNVTKRLTTTKLATIISSGAVVFSRLYFKVLTATITTVGIVRRIPTRFLVSIITGTSTISRITKKTQTGLSNLNSNLNTFSNNVLSFTREILLTSSISKKAVTARNGALELGASLTKLTASFATSSISTASSIARVAKKQLVSSILGTSSVDLITGFLISVGGAITSSSNLVKRMSITNIGNAFANSAVGKFATKAIASTVTTNSTIIKYVARIFASGSIIANATVLTFVSKALGSVIELQSSFIKKLNKTLEGSTTGSSLTRLPINAFLNGLIGLSGVLTRLRTAAIRHSVRTSVKFIDNKTSTQFVDSRTSVEFIND